MRVRDFVPSDLDELQRIYDAHFSHEFSFPNFINGFLCRFIVENEEGKIITAGGIRTIAESMLITDLDINVKERYCALNMALEVSAHFGKRAGFDGLHAFIQNPKWEKRLLKSGFTHTKGKSLVMEI